MVAVASAWVRAERAREARRLGGLSIVQGWAPTSTPWLLLLQQRQAEPRVEAGGTGDHHQQSTLSTEKLRESSSLPSTRLPGCAPTTPGSTRRRGLEEFRDNVDVCTTMLRTARRKVSGHTKGERNRGRFFVWAYPGGVRRGCVRSFAFRFWWTMMKGARAGAAPAERSDQKSTSTANRTAG